MIMEMFSIFDEKAAAFGEPVYFINEEVCLRNIMAIFHKDPAHAFYLHASDYTIFSLGSFDNCTGEIDFNKRAIMSMIELRAQYQQLVPQEETPFDMDAPTD